MALIGAIGFMAVMVGAMFVVTFAANEATKETHAKGNALVDNKGISLSTVSHTSMVKLGELSRASSEYLANLEDITVTTDGNKVVHHEITGFTQHDSNNLDLYTASGTTIKVQCGVVRLYTEKDGLVDAKPANKEAAAGARQLRAMTYEELEAEFNTLASTESRKLKATSPLEGLHSFFGGMAKSSANSQLYGELVPPTNCPKPAEIISFARPQIPMLSKWSVEVRTNVAAHAPKDPDTWYMSYDVNNPQSKPEMRFESPAEDCRKHVTVSTVEFNADYNEYDAALCSTKSDDTSHIKCPPTAELNGKTCDEFKADWVKANKEIEGKINHEITSCKVGASVETQHRLSVKIQDILKDGSSVWEVGMWVMKSDKEGKVTEIKPYNQDDKDAKYYKVLKVEAVDITKDGESTEVDYVKKAAWDARFEKCDATQHSSTNHAGNRRLKESGRKLSAWTSFQAWASGTKWCGAGTDLDSTACPVSSSDGGDMACHRHDHGMKSNGIIGGMAVRLGCDIDRGLADRTSNWAAQAVFGQWGIAGAWGCYDHGSYNCWNWKSEWWGGYWRYGGYCSGEHTHYGPWRYSSYSHSYGWKAQSRCDNPLPFCTGCI
jgi:hypothetical protein